MGFSTSSGAIIRIGVDGADSSQRDIDKVATSMNRLSDTVHSAMRSLATTIGVGGGLAEVVELSDKYAKFTAQLRLATQSQREYAIAYADVKRISQEAQADLAGTGVLYARIANGTRELGISQSRVAAITEVVNLSLKVSAATTAEAASAQLQLSQAFASGTLRGEEFNAVNEAAPRLMKALADGMGVPIGALKQMASDGKITSQMMADVLPQALETLRAEATQVQTIGGAFQNLKNKVLEFTAVHAQANGTVSLLTTGLDLLANNLTAVMGLLTTMTAVKAGTWLVGWATKALETAAANSALRASTLAAAEADVAAAAAASTLATARVAELRAAVLAAEGNTALAIATNGLIPAQARAIALAEAHTVALSAQSAALGAMSIAGRLAGGALALLGGPIGAVITVLGLAATAWSMMGSSASENSEKSAASVRESTEEILDGLDKQIEKLHERNKLARLGIPTTKNENPANVRLGEVVTAIDAAGRGTGEYANLTLEVRTELLKALGREYGELTAKIAEFNHETDEDTANKNKKNVGEWMTKYATNAEKMTAELDKARKELGDAFTPELETRIRKQFEVKAASTQKEISAYQTLMVAVNEKIAATNREAAGLQPLNEAQKLQVALNEQLASGKLKMTAANKAAYEAQVKELGLNLEQIQARKRNAELDQIQASYAEQNGKALEQALKEAKANEDLARTFGMTKAAIEYETIARMEERVEQLRGIDMADDEIATLERLIEAKKRSAAAMGKVETLETAKKANDELIAEGKRMAESINSSLTDALMRGFESGKGFARNLVDTVRNMFNTLVLRPIISAIVSPVAGAITSSLGMSGAASAATSGAGSAVGAGIGSGAIGASLFNAGGTAIAGFGNMIGSSTISAFGAGFAGTGSTVTSLTAAETFSGAGMAAEAGAASLGATAAAAVPYLAAALAAYAIYKHFDSGNTPHTGGASMASASGSSTIRAESIGFAETKTSSAAEQMTAALASSLVGILDSTAMAFGKTAGYTAATAFADDSSKDGAWGSLVISKLGNKVLDWNDTRSGGSWAPKEFADGDAGQAQYMAALATSVRTALNDIGLPDWAKKMLDGVSASASIEDLAKVVDQINTTERALKMMGESLTGFSSMSDSAVSALISASGGIGALATNASAYYDAFYSQSEKSAGGLKAVSDALSAVGVAMPTTMAAYRAEVEAEMKLGDAGAPVVAVLLKNAGAFAQLQPQIEATTDAARSAADILSEHNDLQKQYDELTMTSAELREKERLSIDASNLALFDSITQRQNVKATTDALQTLFDNLKSGRDGILSFSDSLKLGSLSTLTPIQKYLESERQYSESLAKARANPGDSAAISAEQTAATTFLTASQLINASSAAFVADRARVLGDQSTLADIAGAQMSDAQRQLALAGEQVTGLATLNTTALGIQAAIVNLGAPGNEVAPPFDLQRYTAAAAPGADALVAEIKRLNARIDDLVAETKGRRADAARQADDVAAAIETAGETFVDGVHNAGAAALFDRNNPSRRAAL